MKKIDRQRDRKGVKNMLLQELRFTGRELHFRVTITVYYLEGRAHCGRNQWERKKMQN